MTIHGKEIKVDIDSIEFWGDNRVSKGGIRIQWSGNIGFGQLDIFVDKEGNLVADTECMATNEDKEFVQLILSKLTEKISKCY